MKKDIEAIQAILSASYEIDLGDETIHGYLTDIRNAQKYFPLQHQQALFIKLLNDWESRQNEKIITATAEAYRVKNGGSVITFGVLSVDWPGLNDTCTGVVHEEGWNIYFAKGISLVKNSENLGIILIGIQTATAEERQRLIDSRAGIIQKIKGAAVGTSAKTYLLSEEFKKLELYGRVIKEIENSYNEDDLDRIIGMNGEAVKYFAARSRDYIENRKVEDISRQIVLNHRFLKSAHESGSTIELDIRNFTTNTEGVFTGITVAGPAHMLHLEDCLKTIELVIPRFVMKHNKEFTTATGISLFRIEFVDSTGNPLTEEEQKRLKDAFSKMVLNKHRDRAQWINSTGGFEQYARAIIPLLVRETQSTQSTQVYQSVSQTTDLFIDFKIIVVVLKSEGIRRKLVINTVNLLETVPGFHIMAVKPPKSFSNTEVFIIDLRAHLTAIENTEEIYRTIKEKVHEALGDFRDFDEGMRTLDTAKLKAIRQRLKDIDKNVVRELYYGIEDFFRISASGDEIAAHIRITLEMLNALKENDDLIKIKTQQVERPLPSGESAPVSSLICVSYPGKQYLLQRVLDILEPYDMTLSRLEKGGRDILTCRIVKNGKAVPDEELQSLATAIAGRDQETAAD
ncbi:hypothetical protein JXO52_01080 [bacterium]|nr:hypothetical protein [bacterium]